MSQTPLTDAYLLSRSKGEQTQSWEEFAQSLEIKLRAAEMHLDAAYEAAGLSEYSSEPLSEYIKWLVTK